MEKNNIGILLTNVGSPDSPTPSAIRKYLKQFLTDSRIVELPRIIWLPILYGIILPFRSTYSAKLYKKIWTQKGSPLIQISTELANKLALELQMPVEIGMHYGKPSIASALEKFKSQQIKKIIVLPLFPQYSATTTAAAFDQATGILKTWRNIPDVYTVHGYADNQDYINALCRSIQKYSVQHLLFSFHGIPEICIKKGDPYLEQCSNTVRLVAKELKLSPDQYTLAFQSRLGRAKWLTPYTDKILQELPQRNVKNLHVICPGFAVDCLETLEEINIRGRETFLLAGGESFEYIPALNASDEQCAIITGIYNRIHNT
jgi:protoporphyrin/coproporphyrin ferrochelatase